MEIHEAKSLRWLVNQFPLTLPARHDTDKICNAIHLYAKAGADKLEAQAKQIEELERSQEVLCKATVGYSAEIARLDKEVANLTNHIQENPKPLTNADRIRSMTDEELAELLRDAYDAGSNDAEAWHFGEGHRYSFEWDLEWLQRPAEEE